MKECRKRGRENDVINNVFNNNNKRYISHLLNNLHPSLANSRHREGGQSKPEHRYQESKRIAAFSLRSMLSLGNDMVKEPVDRVFNHTLINMLDGRGEI